VILSADTVVILAADTMGIDKNGMILGKPRDADDARRMLKALRGRAHQVYTCLTVLAVPANIRITELVGTTVYMRDYTDAEIDAYIATGDPFDKAGSYAIQHAGFHPVERIEGCYNNVVGLPLCAVKRALAGVAWPGMKVPEVECDCEKVNFDSG
jgi:septum formation protein